MRRRAFFMSPRQWFAVAASPGSREKKPAQQISSSFATPFLFPPDSCGSCIMIAKILWCSLSKALADTEFRECIISWLSSCNKHPELILWQKWGHSETHLNTSSQHQPELLCHLFKSLFTTYMQITRSIKTKLWNIRAELPGMRAKIVPLTKITCHSISA